MELKERLKSLVKIVMQRSGLSQEELARKMRYSDNYISDMITPSGKVSQKFINNFQLFFKEYLGENGSENQNEVKSKQTKTTAMETSNNDKYVALLEQTNSTLTKTNEALITQIEYLQGEVKKCLSSIAENQVDASVMEISAHEVILQRLATDEAEYVRLWNDVYKKSVVRAKDVRSKGNRIDLDMAGK